MNSFIMMFVLPFVFWTSEDTELTKAGHTWLTKQAVEIVSKDTYILDVPSVSKSTLDLESLVNGPDQFETTYYTWVGHFYDPDTGLNWLGTSYNTALTNFIYHANLAVQPDNTEWNKNLAYSLHYLEDACVPHHASNYTVLNSNHKSFEHFTQKNQEKFKVSKNIYQYTITKNFENDLTKILRDCSIRAKMWAIEVVNSDETSEVWIRAAEYTTKESQYQTALALFRILSERYKDVR